MLSFFPNPLPANKLHARPGKKPNDVLCRLLIRLPYVARMVRDKAQMCILSLTQKKKKKALDNKKNSYISLAFVTRLVGPPLSAWMTVVSNIIIITKKKNL